MADEERDELQRHLFEFSVSPDNYKSSAYQNHLIEQYKLYVEMADRISNRRGVTNTFFATLNTAFLTALVGFIKNDISNIFILLIAGILICIVWAVLLRSYRNLNSAKFMIIGLFEERLPASPYWRAEWQALGKGKDWKKHIPLGPIETYVPLIFAILYLLLLIL